MTEQFDSTDRSGGELLQFALAFIGFVLSATGVVVGSPGMTVFGLFLTLLMVSLFGLRRSPGE
jgi:hypothetical protein